MKESKDGRSRIQFNKNRIRSHFQYGWWVYLAVLAAAVVIWCSVFSKLAQPKANERLNITIVADLDSGDITEELAQELSEELLEALDGKTQKPLKEVNIEIISGTDGMLADTVAMRCLGETDLMIFEEPYLITPMSSNFGALEEEGLKAYFPETELYQEEGETLGLLLSDGNTSCRFTEYCTTHEKCWAFITPVSENAAALNGEGEQEDDAALLALQYLCSRID